MRNLELRLEQSGETVGRKAIAKLWQSGSARMYIELSDVVDLPAAVAPELSQMLNATGKVISVSNAVIRANKDTDRPMFGRLQEFVDKGEPIQRSNGRVELWKRLKGVWWIAAIERMRSGYLRLVMLLSSSERRHGRRNGA